MVDNIATAALHDYKSEETLHVQEAMKSCFFAGMADYSAHPLFTEDVEHRFTAIAASVVDSERQLDLASDFEKLVQESTAFVKANRTADNPRAHPKPGKAKSGI